ncbi:flavin-containing monooxygenase-like protein [Leptodontidium sp. 2 PMI_412]|nr:flavin-containing monooxygenase-like protein [Leptodontidium sp. 2 PMI_412]
MVVRVAVIGAGGVGLSATKTFLEDGFEVTTYESRDYVGGLWKDSNDSTISVHSTTIFNTSKYRAALSDFPLAETDDDYPTAAQLYNWLQRYAQHFNLLPRIKLGTKVLSIKRVDKQWALEKQNISTGEVSTEYFDKVCIATGTFFTPKWPHIDGLENFQGRVIHSIDYHQPEEFKDQNVLLIGIHATAQDVTNSLSSSAKHVYLAHRSGLLLLPRYGDDGATSDQAASLKFTLFMAFMYRHFPLVINWLLNKILIGMSAKAFPDLPEEWGMRPAPHVAIATPLMADTLWTHLRSGFAEPVTAVKRVRGPKCVELMSGRVVEDVDSIVYCTGYNTNIPEGLIPKTSGAGSSTGTGTGTESLHPYPGDSAGQEPYLYRNIFPLHSDEAVRNSIAFLGHGAIIFPGLSQFELNAMAISQIWLGNSALPSHHEMVSWYKRNKAERQSNVAYYGALENSTYYPTFMNMGDHLKWVDDTAGTGVYRNLGTAWVNWRAWRLWWRDRELYTLCMGGLLTPFVWRLFETGKRRAMGWGECREMILRQNWLAGEQKRRMLESRKKVL